MKLSPVKKAAKTRAVRRAQKQYYEDVIRPARATMFLILKATFMAYPKTINLRFRPGNTGRKLKHGAMYASLVGVRQHDLIEVLIEGYKRPQVFNAAFWEVLLP